MAAEELVQRVLAGDVQGEPLGAPAGPPPHLPQARDRAGEGDADRRVQLPDVDPELERIRGDHREQLAGRQPGLDLAALLGRVAGAVGGDSLCELGAAELLEPGAGKALDQLDSPPAAQEADRSHPLADQVGQQLGGLGEDRAPRHRPLVDDRRVPDPDPPPGARSAVRIDQAEGLADQPLGELHRVGDRGRGEDEPGAGPVQARDPPQAAQDVGDVGAEHAPVGVGLVHDHPAQAGEEVAPALVVGQDADVEHVGVGEDQVRATPDLRPVLARRVAVVDRVAQLRQPERGQLPRLVLGERLGRVEVEGPLAVVPGELVQHRQVEGERLARSGAAGHDRVADRRPPQAPRAGGSRAPRSRSRAGRPPARGRGWLGS